MRSLVLRRRRQVGWWVGALAAALAAVPSMAQVPKSAPAKAQQPAPADEPPERELPGPEVFLDPKAKALMGNQFPQLFRNEASQPAVYEQIRGMADGRPGNPLNAQVLQRFVRSMAKELTDHRNIEALLDPASNPNNVKALEEAANRLAIPLDVALAKKNTAFRREMVRAMLAPGVADALLKNHLYARVQFLVALSLSGDPQAIDTFLALLADPEQPDCVKLLAANGLSRIVGGGSRADEIDTVTRIKCARGLSDFLRRETGAIWPAQERALQALGAMRLDSADPQRNDLEFLTTALQYLVGAAVAPEVRARAAWTIGMMRIAPNAGVNLPMIAHHVGMAGVDLGERALADYNATAEDAVPNELAKYWATRMVALVYYGFKGDPEVPASGLLTIANRVLQGEDARAIAAIDERLREASKASLAMTRAAGALKVQEKKNATDRLAELRGFLTKNPPKDWALVPRGPEFRPAAASGEVSEPAAPATRATVPSRP